jgi:hypothetical protein
VSIGPNTELSCGGCAVLEWLPPLVDHIMSIQFSKVFYEQKQRKAPCFLIRPIFCGVCFWPMSRHICKFARAGPAADFSRDPSRESGK